MDTVIENGEKKAELKVRYSTSRSDAYPTIYAHALKAEVISAVGYPDHIFVFHRNKANTEGDYVDEFTQIASPLEIEEVPEDAPDLQNGMPYYRAKEVTVWFRALDDLELAKAKMKEDIRDFALTYDVITGDLTDQEEETYGK